MDVMALARPAGSQAAAYALTQCFTPKLQIDLPDKARLSPLMDMLNVRYVVLRGARLRKSGRHFKVRITGP